ncbi:MAG: hypothetical protein K2W85_04940 [Phycisphaerales bacterium]|nr:hypothetical protein [Phycisphaerales bacterium]
MSTPESGLIALDVGGERFERPLNGVMDDDATLQLPPQAGVLVLEASDGRTVLVATTANLRDLTRRRLGPIEPGERSASADVRDLCAGGRLIAIRTGSALETDAVYLRLARERLEHAARIVSERWRAWFVHVDPDAEFPEWTKTNLVGLVRTRSAGTSVTGRIDTGVLLGPIPNKDAAGRFIEHAIDAFDLCRFHHLLVQAPSAVACAYKEMGRCPAPCDGSEWMAAYRERTRRAVAALSGRIEAKAAEFEAAQKSAAELQEFEHAAQYKRMLERIKPLRAKTFAEVDQLSTWQRLLVLRGEAKGSVRIGVMDRGNLWRVGDVEAKDSGAVRAMCALARSHAAQLLSTPVQTIEQSRIDSIALVSRWLQMSTKKRGGVAIAFGDGFEGEAVKAARPVAKIDDAEVDVDAQEIDGLG